MTLKYRKYLPVALIILVLLMTVPFVAFAQESFNLLERILWGLVVAVFGRLAGVAGFLLDISVTQFVIGFGTLYITPGGIGQAIDSVWVNVRDIFNITFIFGLVYLGFKMILNSDDNGTKRWLAYLIMAALLVNFSLYFTKFIVDLSNIIATEIAVSVFTTATGVVSVTDSFMSSMGATSALSADPPTLTEGSPLGYIFGSMITFIVMTFVFGTGAMLLLIRFAALLFYLALSPFMFIGWVFPKMQHLTDQYWKGFLGRAFFAPIYLLLLYLSSRVLSAYSEANAVANGNSSLAGVLSGSGDVVESTFMGTLPPFIVGCIFLVASVIIAQKMGAQGAGAALGAGKNVAGRFRRGTQRMAGNATAGGAAWALRSTGGRLGNYIANDKDGKRRAANSLAGKMLFGAAQGVAGASFDARNVAGVGKGLGVGEGKKGGYTKTMKDKKKKQDEFLKAIKTDVDDPKVQAEIAEEAKKMQTDKETEADNVQKDIGVLKGDMGKTKDELDKEIAELRRAIAIDDDTFDRDEKGGQKTKSELSEIKSGIEDRKRALEIKKDLAAKTESVDKLAAEIEKLKTEKAATDVNPLDKVKLQNQIDAKVTDHTAANTEKQNLVTTAETTRDTLVAESKDVKSLNKSATRKVKYANETAYIKQLQRREKGWRGKVAKVGLVTAGIGAGVAAGGLIGAGALATGGLMVGGAALANIYRGSKAGQTEELRKDAVSKYGAEGEKAEKNESQNRLLADLAKKVKENDAGDADTSDTTPDSSETETT